MPLNKENKPIYIYRLSITWKSDLTDKMKRSFFQAAVVSILLYGCTTWMLTKRLEKKIDGIYTKMPRVILNKSWRQHPMRHQLYGHLPLITKTIQVRRTRREGHCWRSSDVLISDVLLWTPSNGRTKAGQAARTYIQQLCEDTGCSPEDLPEAMNDREELRGRVRDIRAGGTTWWYIYIYILDSMMSVKKMLRKRTERQFLGLFAWEELLLKILSVFWYFVNSAYVLCKDSSFIFLEVDMWI